MFIISYDKVEEMLHENVVLCVNIIIIKTIVHASKFIGHLQGFFITKLEFYFCMFFPFDGRLLK